METRWTLIGVILGGTISLVGTLISNKKQNKYAKEIFVLQKRTEIYIPIIEGYLSTVEVDMENQKKIKFYDNFQKIDSNFFLLSSKKVKKQLEKVKDLVLEYKIAAKNDRTRCGKLLISTNLEFAILLEMMKKDIGISD